MIQRTKSTCNLIVALSVFAIFAHAPATADEPITFDQLIITVIDSVEVPASRTGVIATVSVHEGDTVRTGQTIANTDDREARVKAAIAQTQLDILQSTADNDLATEKAEAELGAQRQSAKEHLVRQKIADRLATNDVQIQASEKSAAVAKNELDRALRSRAEYSESVSASEIEGLRLTYERSQLESEQATFERAVDRLKAQAESEAASRHVWAIQQFTLALEQSKADQHIADLNLQLGRRQSELATLETERHRVVSPLDGVVAEVFQRAGDWVTEGEPIARVIRLDRLRAEGFASFDQLSELRKKPRVDLIIEIGNGEQVERTGTVVFVSPEIDPVNNEVKFWIEFDNPAMDVLPGMRLSARRKS
ncbi:Multidrug resistance protein MdtE precursor [Rubripirellula tenax]|uniref:Multidrug resistance protein MdtE n=1 Tax=Rubripirellula tenax TaxID=2528015 RepID=A0A5C6F3F6_9BACT|nr:HlyD family efflux transporter periplasmic adaptor subunit [Rubripirellula tenax]TWU54576.1 Multidrug resistance protein MdtE precursor [Rubripirellula tenax]